MTLGRHLPDIIKNNYISGVYFCHSVLFLEDECGNQARGDQLSDGEGCIVQMGEEGEVRTLPPEEKEEEEEV